MFQVGDQVKARDPEYLKRQEVFVGKVDATRSYEVIAVKWPMIRVRGLDGFWLSMHWTLA